MNQRHCPKCNSTINEDNFYTTRQGVKFELCKKCTTMHINNTNPETYEYLLELADVPYIPEEWFSIYEKAYQKDPYKITGMSVFGKYLSKMKLRQWKNYGYADTEAIIEERKKKAEAAESSALPPEEQIKQAYERGEISEAQYQTFSKQHMKDAVPPPPMSVPSPKAARNGQVAVPPSPFNPYPINDHPYEVVELIDVGAELTKEDKVYLAMKWGQLYRADEWVQLEKFYNEMMESFDIQGAARIDTLKMICKTSLKMNQSLDSGDIDNYQKLARVYDSMMKSAKFTEAQNKEGGGDFVDSIGELVAMCERDGFIPRFATDIPQDKVDKTLQDMNNYLYKLVTQDMGLGDQIEHFLNKIELQRAEEANNNLDEIISLEEEEEQVLEDADMIAYYEQIEAEKDDDALAEGSTE